MNHLRHHERPVYGADTETVNGKPYTYQFFGEGLQVVREVGPRNVTEHFFHLLRDSIKDKARVFLHNLEFDMPVLFYPYLRAFVNSSFTLTGRFEAEGFRVQVLFGKVNHADIRIGSRSWELVDTFAFFKSSLESLARTFGLPSKLPKPRRLGSVYYEGAELEAFKRYALRDAEIAQGIGLHIVDFHRRYDVRPCISAPQLASRIFKHKFFPANSVIPSNPDDLDAAAVLSYHGGKNGLYVPPGIYRGVGVYDINSAYPYAMTQVPNFLGCRYDWLSNRDIHRRMGGAPPVPGIYCISGESLAKTYNPLRDHEFKPLVGGFDKVWVTSYELELMMQHGFLGSPFALHEAFIVEPTGKKNPFRDFALHFFKLKQKERGPLREFYKVMLNSLYGKFVQNVASVEGEGDMVFDGARLEAGVKSFQAGGLWNPLLASLITGYVRAMLTKLEIRYGSLHSATDSVMTRQSVQTDGKLGGLSLQTRGTAVLLRPKLYLLWNGKREVTAYALHGFHGNLASFVRLLRSGKRRYFHQRIRKVKESFRQGVQPLTMTPFFKTINLDVEGGLAIPKLKVQTGKGVVNV